VTVLNVILISADAQRGDVVGHLRLSGDVVGEGLDDKADRSIADLWPVGKMTVIYAQDLSVCDFEITIRAEEL
jgi:hypothetical protein